jgi:hypothetical protein
VQHGNLLFELVFWRFIEPPQRPESRFHKPRREREPVALRFVEKKKGD